jgi:N utilization substance protein A
VEDDEPRYLFMRTLGVKLAAARELEAAGLTSLDEVAYIPLAELLEIKSIPEHHLVELRKVARAHLLKDALGGEGLPPGPYSED